MIYERPGVVCWGRRGRRRRYRVGDPASRAAALRLAQQDGLLRALQWLADEPRRADAAHAPRGPVPSAQERLFERMLRQRVALVRRLVVRLVMPKLAGVRGDAVDPLSSADALGVIRAIQTVLGDLGEGDKAGLKYVAEEIEEKSLRGVDRQLTRLYQIPIASVAPTGVVSDWVETNAQLITSIPSRYLDEVGKVIEDGVRSGAPVKRVLELISGRFGVARSRASLIARDQTAKLTAKVRETRHRTLGVEEYIWSSSGDSRVRQRHADLDGTVQRYDDPPVADERGNRAHPGELWQCRCTARPIRPQDDVALLRAQQLTRQEREAQLLSQSPTVRGEVENRSGFTDWNRKRLSALRRGGESARRAVGLPRTVLPPR